MPVLLLVVDRMKEKSVAPVLAAMSPAKAKDVTVQLAEQRKLQKSRGGPPSMPAGAADTSGNGDASGDNPAASPASDSGASPAPAAGASPPAAASPAQPAPAAAPAASPTPAAAR